MEVANANRSPIQDYVNSTRTMHTATKKNASVTSNKQDGTDRASSWRPVISIIPGMAMNVSRPQFRKMPVEKWGRPGKKPLLVMF